ncbi:MAG: hypothetical protein C0619_07320 [Desulfuromonas sp.]|nr:MAG: hypothetical protein C0619_07320 [Desulfuromonas sp.]
MDHVRSNSSKEGREMIDKVITKRQAGFTLIEMMIALFILSVSILALTAVTITAMKANLENDARNVAVRLTGEVAEEIYSMDFSAAKLEPTGVGDDPHVMDPVPDVDLRGVKKKFNVTWRVAEISATMKRVDISVSYDIKGKTYTNRSVVYRPSET